MKRILATFIATLSLAAAKSPNLIVILADDLGYGDLRCFGATEMQTPNLDRLMARGIRFDRFYANCTVCSPTRASLLTGRYPDLVGVPGVIRQDPQSNWGRFQPTGPTLPELLQNAGYHTALIGKWHLGLASPNLPNERGFSFFHGFLGDMMDDYYRHTRGGVNWMRRDREEIHPAGHATELFTDWSVSYLEERAAAGKPFFLYLAYNAPHFPIQPPKEWRDAIGKREPQLAKARADNVAFVEHLDHEIGRVITAIERLHLAENTLIVFSSDNGGSLPHAQSNGPLRGGKQDHWEGGIRVPTCAVWDGTIPAGLRCANPCMTMDLLPTLCEIAGAPIHHEIDGRSIAHLWSPDPRPGPERPLIWMRREGSDRYQGRAYYAIRQGNWKLFQNTPFEPMRLVDVEADPREENPLPPSGEIAAELARRLTEHIRRSGGTPWQ